MDRQKLLEIFNKQPRIGTLSTANTQGDVNVAVFGSPQMIDENTVVMGIGENRSLKQEEASTTRSGTTLPRPQESRQPK